MIRRTYTKELIEQWKSALKEAFGFEEYMDMLIQPSFGKNYLTYLPLLNYTDRTSQNIEDLLELAKDNHYQIRTLNFEYNQFKDFDPVTLRLDIANKSLEEIERGYKKLAKRNVKKEKRLARYQVKTSKECKKDGFIEKFYAILKNIYKRHGTPLFPIDFLHALHNNLEDMDIFFLCEGEEPIGGVLFFYDNKIATLQYGGIFGYKSDNTNGYALYHGVIEHIIEHKDIEIIDFGRSPYNKGTYFFKTRFGAKPVKIDIHTSNQKNIYNSYKLASEIWKRLPSPITDFVGPKLTKYLVDL